MSTVFEKVKSSEFIAGYAYKSIEYNCSVNTQGLRDIPQEGYSNDVVFPKVWVSGVHKSVIDTSFSLKMDDVIARIISAFYSTFSSKYATLVVSWGTYDKQPNHVQIQYKLLKSSPKRMTVEQIEKELGYKVEIVSEGN